MGHTQVSQSKKAVTQATQVTSIRIRLRNRQYEDETAFSELPSTENEITGTSGEPLDPDTRALMERRFGHDFSQVRIHTDAEAAASASELNASAFTRGQDIFFAPGRYQPDTVQGRRLLAHELAHTLQQRPAYPSTQNTSATHVPANHNLSQPGNPLEREADVAAQGVMDGRAVPLQSISLAAPLAQGMTARQVATLTPNASTAPSQQEAHQPAPEDSALLDPTQIVDSLVDKLVSSLRSDPDDLSGRVRRQIGMLAPSTHDAVMERIQVRLSSSEWDHLNRLLVEHIPLEKENTPPVEPLVPEPEPAPQPEAAPEKPAAEPTKEAVGPEAPSEIQVQVREAAAPAVTPEAVSETEEAAPETKAIEVPETTVAGEAEAPTEGTAPSEAAAPREAAAPPTVEGAPAGEGEAAPVETPAPAEEEAVPPTEGGPAEVAAAETGVGVAPTAPETEPTAEVAGAEVPAAETVPGAGAEAAAEPTEEVAVPEPGTSTGTPMEAPVPEEPAVAETEPRAAEAEAEPSEEAAAPAIATTAEPTEAVPTVEPEVPPAPETTAAAPETEVAPSEEAVAGEPAPEAPASTEMEEPVESAGGQVESGTLTAPEGAAAGPEQPKQETNFASMVEIPSTSDDVPTPGGGGSGGSPIQESPAPQVPDVSQAEPTQALTQVGNLPPAQLQQALGGVSASASRAVEKQRSELAANPPQMERPSGVSTGKEAPTGVSETTPAEGSAAERHVKRVPAGQPVPAARPAPLPPPPPPATQEVSGPRVGGDPQGQLSADDAQKLQTSLQNLPTHDPALDVTAGSPPPLVLEGDADPARAQEQRTQLEQSTVEAQVQGQTDAAQPMGEGEIYPDVPQETLQAEIQGVEEGSAPKTSSATGATAGASAAQVTASAAPAIQSAPSTGIETAPPATGASAPPSPAAGGAAGEGTDEATSIIAQQERGNEIRASVAQARAQMNTKKQEQASKAAEAHTNAQHDIDQEIQHNSEEQANERKTAQTEVQQQRGEWNQEQNKLVDGARTEADQVHQQGQQDVTDQQKEGETQANQHIQQGNTEIAEARSKGEQEAETARKDGENKSKKGFFGRLADAARSFFDEVKGAIKQAFDRARAFVRSAIQKAQQLASAVIDKARQAIVGIIRKVGDKLIEIGDRVLAGFPGLRDRFRKAIKERVERAVAVVNALADKLKAGVQRALNFLGAALNAALGMLEQGLLAAVDSVNSVVQGAIKFASAVVQALADFAALIKDIAAHPLQWLKNLGAAIMDGIRNHLWKAFKAAVKNWFNEKVEQVLGLGVAIWNLLRKGGISLAEVAKMAWEAIKQAIPGILIRILIEKLVSLLIPAAAAVMAIIEGLKAAWNTAQRILQAFQRFIAFLKAVKTGQAGPKFADALAAAAIAVIEFAANWLLQRLQKPASGVAGTLRKIAQKIGQRLGAVVKAVGRVVKAVGRGVVRGVRAAGRGIKAVGRGIVRGVRAVGRGLRAAGRAIARSRIGQAIARSRLGRAVGRVVGRVKEAIQRGRERFRAWRERRNQRKAQSAQERLDKAVKAIQPQLHSLLMAGTSKFYLLGRLLLWRVRYLLSSLRIQSDGSILAKVNSEDIIAKIDTLPAEELGQALEKVLINAENELLENFRNTRGRKPDEEMIDLAYSEDVIRDIAKGKPARELPALSTLQLKDLLERVRSGNILGEEKEKELLISGNILEEKGEVEKKQALMLPIGGGVKVRIKDPQNVGTFYVTHLGSYERIARTLTKKVSFFPSGKAQEVEAKIVKAIGSPNQEVLEKHIKELRGWGSQLKEKDFDVFARQLRRANVMTTIEAARAPGQLAATALASTAEGKIKDVTETLAPMAVAGSSKTIEAGRPAPVSSPETTGMSEKEKTRALLERAYTPTGARKVKSGEQKELDEATSVRYQRIVNIFKRLVETATHSADIQTEAGTGKDVVIANLAKAFEAWLDAKLKKPEELEAAGAQLQAQLLFFLKSYHGLK
jgi:Domain of unknown function (DUF4157)